MVLVFLIRAALTPLIGQFLGLESKPIHDQMSGKSRSVSIPGVLDQAIEGVCSPTNPDEARGRLEFGAGTGVSPHEFIRWNVPFDRRREISEEALAIVIKTWTEDT